MTAWRWAGVALAVTVLFPTAAACQRVYSEYTPVEGTLRIGPEPDRAIPMVDKGYFLALPDGEAEGVVVQLDAWPTSWGPEDPAPGTLDTEALRHGLGVLHLTTGNRVDFLFHDEGVTDVARRIQGRLEEHELQNVPVYFAGLSLGGTRALRVAVYLAQHPDDFWLRPAAVAVADAPLDMTRLWHAEQRAAALDFHPAAADEGRWVSYVLETNLGGRPDENPEAYVAYSPYSHGAPLGGNARHLTGLPVRAYHEPDVDWWIEHRRKSYYEMNSLDLAAFVTELKVQGNASAVLVTTHQQRDGFEDHTSPHTWSIVDNEELVRWLLEQKAP